MGSKSRHCVKRFGAQLKLIGMASLASSLRALLPTAGERREKERELAHAPVQAAWRERVRASGCAQRGLAAVERGPAPLTLALSFSNGPRGGGPVGGLAALASQARRPAAIASSAGRRHG
jgi:hypothetical protein